MKFYVKDECGENYVVEEVEEKEVHDDEFEPEKEKPSLTDEEILALKKLALSTDKLLALLADIKDEDADTGDDEGMDPKEIMDEDSEKDDEEDEEKEDKKVKDSKSSFGSLEKQKKVVKDSSIDRDTAIADAWSKRYGGAR